MNPYPLVSIIMPVYNAESYIDETIQSIINQDYQNIEILIVDDCSTDNTFSIISKYQDNRIRLSKNVNNIGYVKTLNNLIKVSNGKFIARHDNDDISMPNRIRSQVDYLLNNTKVDVCGSNFIIFGAQKIKSSVPISDEEIKCFMLLNNPLCHPTVMFRADIFTKYNLWYNSNFSPSEDYLLWYQLSTVTCIHNINDNLLLYRWHANNTSVLKKDLQIYKTNEIRNKILFETLGIKLNEFQQNSLTKFIYEDDCTYKNVLDAALVFNKIISSNNDISYYNKIVLKDVVSKYFITVTNSKKKLNFAEKILLIFKTNLFTYNILKTRFHKNFFLK